MIPRAADKSYEPPKIVVMGTVHGLTHMRPTKQHGPSDGFMFLASQITKSS